MSLCTNIPTIIRLAGFLKRDALNSASTGGARINGNGDDNDGDGGARGRQRSEGDGGIVGESAAALEPEMLITAIKRVVCPNLSEAEVSGY